MSDEFRTDAEAPAPEVEVTDQPDTAAEESTPDFAPAQEEAIPEYRFKQVVQERNELREALQEVYRQQLQNNSQPSQPQVQDFSYSDDEDGDILRTAREAVRQEFQPVQQQISQFTRYMDQQQEEAFWARSESALEKVGMPVDDVRAEVELLRLQNEAQGRPVSRDEALTFVMGRRLMAQQNDQLARAGAVRKQVAKVNKVAQAESMPKATAPGQKKLEEMTADELLDAFGDQRLD